MADKKFTVGQLVKVYYSYGRGVPRDGQITRVGRTLVDIRADKFGNIETFRMSDQKSKGDGGGSGTYFRTIEQYEDQTRRFKAVNRLTAFGCRFDLGFCSVPVEKMERIADILEEGAH